MEIETITIEPEVAEKKLRAYRAQLHRRANEKYELIARGYKELARGRALINLSEVIVAGGFDDRGRPNIAIARADRRQVRFDANWSDGSRGLFDASSRNLSGHSETLQIGVDLPAVERGGRREGYALVPIVPADVIEDCGGRVGLSAHFVLWEVERWSDRPLGAVPDRDPYLLKHIGGELYAVMAAWDLTDLERAVMAGRRNR